MNHLDLIFSPMQTGNAAHPSLQVWKFEVAHFCVIKWPPNGSLLGYQTHPLQSILFKHSFVILAEVEASAYFGQGWVISFPALLGHFTSGAYNAPYQPCNPRQERGLI